MPRGSSLNDTAALAEWRRKAVTVFSLASAVAYLPAVALMLAGQAPPNGWLAQVILVMAYLSFVFCSLFYRADYRVRAWAILTAGYVVALIHLITVPEGPFGRALPIMLPMVAIVLLGVQAGRATTAVSIAVLLFGPLLQRVSGLVEILTAKLPETPTTLNTISSQDSALIALLLGLMILLDRFHEFLMQSLARLQREAAERAAAYRGLEHEMHERRRLEREVASVVDEEQNRFGAEIHDGVCQQLTGALLRCEALARSVERKDAVTIEELTAVSSLLEEAIDEAHAVARGLATLGPDPRALATALGVLSKRTRGATGLECRFEPTGDIAVPDPATAQHLYRIAQEAVSNAARHARATRIEVSLRGGVDGLVLAIEDNGDGIPTQAPNDGMGLRTMAYRAHLLDGEFSVVHLPADAGTRVQCRVPRAALTQPPEPSNHAGELNRER